MDRKQEIIKIVRDTIMECANVLHDVLPAAQGEAVLKAASVLRTETLKVDFSARRARSNGGIRHRKAWMSIAAAHYLHIPDDQATTFHEYKSFAWNPVIGSLKDVCWRDALRCLVAHEFAHVAQFAIWYDPVTPPEVRAEMRPPHGYGWKRLYRTLREKLINPNAKHIEPESLEGEPELVRLLVAASRREL